MSDRHAIGSYAGRVRMRSIEHHAPHHGSHVDEPAEGAWVPAVQFMHSAALAFDHVPPSHLVHALLAGPE